MLCAISESKLGQLSAWSPDVCVKNRLKREWANVLGWLPQGSWKYPPMHKLVDEGVFNLPSSVSVSYCIHILLSLLILPTFLSLSISLSFLTLASTTLVISLYHRPASSTVCISPSVFCTHVLRRRQKPTMLECMCSRSGADCATAEMSFYSNCILLWSDDTQTLIRTIILRLSSVPPLLPEAKEIMKKRPFHVIWVCLLASKITKGNEKYSEFLYFSRDRNVFVAQASSDSTLSGAIVLTDTESILS